MLKLYKIGIEFYYLIISLLVPFNQRASAWFKGRKNQKICRGQDIQIDQPVIWFHASSLGEFEQGKPVIRKWRLEKPGYFILLTFFSPSGYLIEKDNPEVDKVMYIPLERRRDIKFFLDSYHPRIAVFIKYEIWPIILDELYQRAIPSFLISSVFRKKQIFFKWYGSWYLSVLSKFSEIFVQDPSSYQLLISKGIRNVKIAGDSRIDRVLEIAEQNAEIEGIKEFAGDSRIIIAGSSWPTEEQYLNKFLRENSLERLKLIIAPHDVNNDHLKSINDLFGNNLINYSQLLDDFSLGEGKTVLLIDRVGILSKIYRYGHLAIVGGAFGAGLHNVLEPAVFGIPIVFGPRFTTFIEASELIEMQAAFSVKSYDEFRDKLLVLLNDENSLSSVSKGCREYVNKRKGASALIISHLLEKA